MKGFSDSLLLLSSSWKVVVQDLSFCKGTTTTNNGSTTKFLGDDGLTTSSRPANTGLASVGFTLIELLVVVLIIGILAAVAVPQYQLAVDKSKFASNMPLLDATETAQEVYYLANGQYATEFEQLDMQIPKAFSIKLPDSMGGDCWGDGTSLICTNQCYSYLALWGTQAAIYFRTHTNASFNSRRCANANSNAKRACVVGRAGDSSQLARWRRLCNSLGTETSQHYGGGIFATEPTFDLR